MEASLNLKDLVTYHVNTFSSEEIDKLRHKFSRDGFVKISNIINEDIKLQVHHEILNLVEKNSERRDIRLATTDNTPRHMSVIRSHHISEHGKIITTLSRSNELKSFLEKITLEELHDVPNLDEEYVITKQDKAGDTHGWHWGDCSYALIWIVKTPPIQFGGMLQCIPHTSWNKEKPRVYEYLCENPITTYALESGDVYLLKTDTTLHRTVPINEDGRTRIMLNMSWASQADITKLSLQVDDRWWDNVSAEKAIAHEKLSP
jgi:hypothetical protein